MNNLELIKLHLKNYGGKVYRANKEMKDYNPDLHPVMGESGKKAFGYFKELCLSINNKIKVKKKITFNQWQNSGNMIDYFWCQFKSEERANSASSISLFAFPDDFELVIEWDSKKSEVSENKREEHNSFINRINEWIVLEKIYISKYYITILDLTNSKEYKLEEFLKNREILNLDKGLWIRIGKKYIENDEAILSKEVVEMINELEFLYQCTKGEKTSDILTQEIDINERKINIKCRIEKIEEYINNNSYIYTKEHLSNFYLSLKTKPFVILAGISGTGKSRLVELFAEAIDAKYELISVRPDWNDCTELLGYKNIKEEFVKGRLYEIIEQAIANPEKPHFVCLDEMNLARVEYYLSDYLSVIESRKLEYGEIVTKKLFSEKYFEGTGCNNIGIPENLYIIGTVNMDDTTFSFSRKVLDRANTIEFSEVDLENLDFPEGDAESIDGIDNSFLKTTFLNIKDALSDESNKEYVEKVNKKIVHINEILKPYSKHFGYRVRDEIVFYMLENKIAGLLDEDMAFDYQIMQKILPTIIGSDSCIKEILLKLFKICTSIDLSNENNYLEEAEKIVNDNSKEYKYKKSAKKIVQMLKGYKDGFVSFWQ